MKKTVPLKLYGPRLTLKRDSYSIDLAKELFSITDKNREYLRKYLDWVDSTTRIEDTLSFLHKNEKDGTLGTKLSYCIYLENKLIGHIAAFTIDRHNSTEIGYWLDQEFTKKGYMTEAVNILEKELFENFDINRIQIKCDVKNLASKKVAERCGYTLEGSMREAFYNPYFNGYRDEFLFSKLKSDFLSTPH